MQEADELGTRVRIRRDLGDEGQAITAGTVMLRAGLQLEVSWKNNDSPGASRYKESGWETIVPR